MRYSEKELQQILQAWIELNQVALWEYLSESFYSLKDVKIEALGSYFVIIKTPKVELCQLNFRLADHYLKVQLPQLQSVVFSAN